MSAVLAVKPPTELVRFVLARLDDDEDALRRATRLAAGSSGEVDFARMKSDATARRQVVGHVQQLLVLRDQPNEKAVRDVASHILRSLAMPYADHPGFRDDWRVSVR